MPPCPALASALAAVLMVAGVGLRVWQYAGNPSLWLDEAFLANSILFQPLRELLTGPIYYGQYAAKGFLLVERLAVVFLGPTDAALRLFPLLASCAVLPITWAAARRLVGDSGALAAVGLLAFSPGAFYFVQVKQYASDMLATAAIVLAGLDLLERRRARTWAVVGVLLAWVSQPVAFVLAGVGAAAVIHDRRNLPVAAAWWVSALASGLVSLASAPAATDTHVREFWAAGWIPLAPSALRWAASTLVATTGGEGLRVPFPFVWAGLACIGAVALATKGTRGAVAWAPAAVALAASALRIYPLQGRLLAFLLPVLAIWIAAGAAWVAARVRLPRAAALAAAPALVAALLDHPVRSVEDIRPALRHLEAAARPGDAVYVYYAAAPAFERYRPELHLPDVAITIGANLRDGRPVDVLEKQARSSRAWLVFAHERPEELDALLQVMRCAGREVEARSFGGIAPARLHLFELAAVPVACPAVAAVPVQNPTWLPR